MEHVHVRHEVPAGVSGTFDCLYSCCIMQMWIEIQGMSGSVETFCFYQMTQQFSPLRQHNEEFVFTSMT